MDKKAIFENMNKLFYLEYNEKQKRFHYASPEQDSPVNRKFNWDGDFWVTISKLLPLKEIVLISRRLDYLLHDKKIPIIWRLGGVAHTDPCPYCQRNHEHAMEAGMRMPHCKSGEDRMIVDSSGDVFTKKRGYLILNYYLKVEKPTEWWDNSFTLDYIEQT